MKSYCFEMLHRPQWWNCRALYKISKRLVSNEYPLLHIPVSCHDDVIKWKHFPRCWPFVRGIRRSPMNSPLKGQWRGTLMSSLIYVWINGWVNNREADDLRCHHAHYDVTVMVSTHRRSHHRTKAFLHCYTIKDATRFKVLIFFIYSQNWPVVLYIVIIYIIIQIIISADSKTYFIISLERVN